jgi:hypothetical protein
MDASALCGHQPNSAQLSLTQLISTQLNQLFVFARISKSDLDPSTLDFGHWTSDFGLPDVPRSRICSHMQPSARFCTIFFLHFQTGGLVPLRVLAIIIGLALAGQLPIAAGRLHPQGPIAADSCRRTRLRPAPIGSYRQSSAPIGSYRQRKHFLIFPHCGFRDPPPLPSALCAPSLKTAPSCT